MSYFGGKGGSFRTLINQIPPHDVYIEPFLGGGAVMLNKEPAQINVGSDIDKNAIYYFLCSNNGKIPNLRIYPDRAENLLSIQKGSLCYWIGNYITFVYCDPPYVLSSRKSGPRYNHELTDDQHKELLKLLLSLKCMVMISGYRHAIYDDALSSWRRIDYKANTRRGLVDESAWMNYPEPTELHDYRYLGNTYREREKFNRRTRRWVDQLNSMPILLRKKIIAAINDKFVDGGHHRREQR